MFIQILSKLSLSKAINGPNSGNLKISHSKYNILSFGSKRPSFENFSWWNCITQSDTVKDLGITIYSDLKFKHHINNITCIANLRSALINLNNVVFEIHESASELARFGFRTILTPKRFEPRLPFFNMSKYGNLSS